MTSFQFFLYTNCPSHTWVPFQQHQPNIVFSFRLFLFSVFIHFNRFIALHFFVAAVPWVVCAGYFFWYLFSKNQRCWRYDWHCSVPWSISVSSSFLIECAPYNQIVLFSIPSRVVDVWYVVASQTQQQNQIKIYDANEWTNFPSFTIHLAPFLLAEFAAFAIWITQ